MLPAPCTSENTLMTHRYAGLSLRAVSTSFLIINIIPPSDQIQLSTENFSILQIYVKVYFFALLSEKYL